jgi:hypothetical protein
MSELTHSCILHSLGSLDARLLRMVEAARVQTGRNPGVDPFRGLYVSEADFFRYASGEGVLVSGGGQLASGAPFEAIRELYGLSNLELDALLLALAPEVDLRYERIFAYLHDDVSRRRPSVDLILSVVSDSAADKLARREMFSGSSPLIVNRLIRLAGDELAPFGRHEVVLDASVCGFLLGQRGLAASVSRFAQLVEAPARSGPADAGLVQLARRAAAGKLPLPVHFRGADEDEKSAAANALAAELGVPLVIADIARAARHTHDLEDWLDDLSRAAFLRQAIVYLRTIDWPSDNATRETALNALGRFRGITIVSVGQNFVPGASARGGITIAFETLPWPERRRTWEEALSARDLHPQPVAVDALTECFPFSYSQIQDAVETASNLAEYRRETKAVEHVFEACRMRSGNELGTLTRRVTPAHSWSDIVLPQETLDQLHEICRRVIRRHQVQEEWGFARKLSGGKGINALFHGHSGTGKTMAAEVVARELRLDLYKIELAGVVSKYIGETEKNLDRIFRAAENANAILLFDEADALFGKRSEVRDSHDRYANLEISYLLQKMEQHEGISILATNLRQNLDDAFLRRLAFIIPFPFPDEVSRRGIWAGIWPVETPLAPDVNTNWLGTRFLLSGGNIRNAALAAAYHAAEEGSAVTISHVLRAVSTEFHKMGRVLTPAELESPLPEAREVAA